MWVCLKSVCLRTGKGLFSNQTATDFTNQPRYTIGIDCIGKRIEYILQRVRQQIIRSKQTVNLICIVRVLHCWYVLLIWSFVPRSTLSLQYGKWEHWKPGQGLWTRLGRLWVWDFEPRAPADACSNPRWCLLLYLTAELFCGSNTAFLWTN